MAVYFGTNKVLDNGVAGTSLVLGHADTHSANGTDPLPPRASAPLLHSIPIPMLLYPPSKP